MSRFELYELVSRFVIDERKQSAEETLQMVQNIRDGNYGVGYPDNSISDLMARLNDHVDKIMELAEAEAE
jgi:hypothetical protein